VLARVRGGEFPPPHEVRAGVPAGLESICLKAMALLPGDRYASALELAEAVERWLADEPLSGFSDLVFTLSADGRFSSLGPAFETRYGWSRAEMLGKPFPAMVHPDDLSRSLSYFLRCLGGETPPAFSMRLLTKSGQYVTDEIAAILQVLEGKVVGVMGISRAL